MRTQLVALAFLALASPALAEDDPAMLSVTGHGTASAAPDMATIRLGVENQAKAPAEAMAVNTAAVERIIAEIRGSGVEDKDIQTANFSVYPVYDHRKAQQEGGAPELVGFRVSNEIVARIHDLDGLGTVLSSVVEAGANSINGLSFDIDDDATLRDEARRLAMTDARQIAELYAEAAGVTLTRILSIREGAAVQPPMPMGRQAMRMEMAESAAAVPIERGESTIDATVSVVWEIAPAE